MKHELEVLDQIQLDTESIAEEVEHFTGVNRREFVFLSLAAAAASTFGFGATALAQGAGGARGGGGGRGGGAGAQAVPLLGNGEPISWTFQPYPGGTGVLMEKLIEERGANAFRRSEFAVQAWRGPVPTDPVEIALLPAHRLSALLKARRITPTQLTRIYLDRIKRFDPELLCAVTIMEESALAEAARADQEIAAGRYRGPLHGIPYGVKDLFSTKGVRTTWGSADFENRIIDEDAEVVVRLRNAGAVLMAKLATGQFASGDGWYRGQTKNPWDTRRGSSGSSAGPASATAAGCVAFGIGTETSGSIVSPARACGMSALRPTFGRVSRHGGMVLAWSQDRVGPICRTIEDCALVFNTIHGADPKDPGTLTTPFEFDRGISLASQRIGVDAGAPADLVEKLRELGARPVPIGPRPSSSGGGFGAESAAAFDSYVQMKARELGVDMATIDAGRGRGGRGAGGGGGGGGGGAAASGAAAVPDSSPGRGRAGGGGGGSASLNRWTNGRSARAFDFINAQRRRHVLITQMQEFLKDLDMYIPTAAGDIGLHAQTGHPCVVVQYRFEAPAGGRGGGRGRGRAGGAGADSTAGGGRAATPAQPQAPPVPQPICALIAGNLYNDDRILSVAHQFQINTDFHTHKPKLG
jgi:hypothetical protein